MDYSSNEPFSMPANVTVEAGKNQFQVLLYNKYPNEPNANSKGKITISKEGDQINGSPMISKEELSSGEAQFTTEARRERQQ